MRGPSDWPAADSAVVAGARRRVDAVLADSTATIEDLKTFYSPDRDYAGPVFDDRTGSDPNKIDARDLLAITAMSVQAGPRAIGKFLQPGELRTKMAAALRATDDVSLWEASPAQLEAADALYRCVKQRLSSANMWVTTGKLCARKRPQLIPVRDRVIVAGLGLPAQHFGQDWLVMGGLLEAHDIRVELQRCAAKAATAGSIIASVPELRLLDAVLWMRWSRRGKKTAVQSSTALP